MMELYRKKKEAFKPVTVCLDNAAGKKAAILTISGYVLGGAWDGTAKVETFLIPRLTLLRGDAELPFEVSGMEEIEALYEFLGKHLPTIREIVPGKKNDLSSPCDNELTT